MSNQLVATDYYELLGVSRDASTEEIKQAYRDRIKESHPDVSDEDGAHEHTKRLIEAKDVLTDDSERRRYDRLGHESYTGERTNGESTPDQRKASNRSATGATGPDHTSRQSTDRHRRTGWQSDSTRSATGREQTGRQQTTNAGNARQADGGQAQHSADWYHGGSNAATDAHRAWESDRSYAVGNDQGMFEPAELLSSQRTIVLLGTTFIIYPVLLFGALSPTFPMAVNLLVAMCIVLVIAFLQSVPRVGMLVFGIWTVLLPIGLFGIVGVSPFTIYGVLAMGAVCFPFGLSVLTWIAIRPMGR